MRARRVGVKGERKKERPLQEVTLCEAATSRSRHTLPVPETFGGGGGQVERGWREGCPSHAA